LITNEKSHERGHENVFLMDYLSIHTHTQHDHQSHGHEQKREKKLLKFFFLILQHTMASNGLRVITDEKRAEGEMIKSG